MFLNLELARDYKSKSQQIRVMSETWALSNAFCPQCGDDLQPEDNNRPVSDFSCSKCIESFELKSKKGKFGHKIVDGAFDTMINRLSSETNPNLFLLSYDESRMKVNDFFIIPKFLFTSNIIEKRKPLSMNAKRAGWVGCNILVNDLPESGKIYFLKDGQKQQRIDVLNNWQKVIFLNKKKDPALKGWLLDIMKCIDLLGKNDFSLEDIYSFESSLKLKHPENAHIKDKIRQQLQYLRDKGYIEFVSRGQYRVIK